MYATVRYVPPGYGRNAIPPFDGSQLAFVVPGSTGYIVSLVDGHLAGARVQVLTLPFIMPGHHRGFDLGEMQWVDRVNRAVLVRRLDDGSVHQVRYGPVRESAL